jgi:deoxyribodipyrimidine photolyase-related protein
MACMDTVLAEIRASGYAHHIQRLMVLANYGLLAGSGSPGPDGLVPPQFIDGYDWVMQTNVIGMGLFADGGLPGQQALRRQRHLHQPHEHLLQGVPLRRQGSAVGAEACPFNSLYWDFLARHQPGADCAVPRMALVMQAVGQAGSAGG